MPRMFEEANKLVGYILCPSHEEKTPSCAVYTTGFKTTYRLYCYGCQRTVKSIPKYKIKDSMLTRPYHRSKRAVVPPTKFPGDYSEAICDFFESRHVDPHIAAHFGVAEVAWSAPTAVHLPVFSITRDVTGGQVRFVEPQESLPKIYSTRLTNGGDYPDYACLRYGSYWDGRVPRYSGVIIIVESIIDALCTLSRIVSLSEREELLYEIRHITCVALLGTHLRESTRQAICSLVFDAELGEDDDGVQNSEPVIYLCGDGDAAGVRSMSYIKSVLRQSGLDRIYNETPNRAEKVPLYEYIHAVVDKHLFC